MCNFLLDSYRADRARLFLKMHSKREEGQRCKQHQGEVSFGLTKQVWPNTEELEKWLLEKWWYHHCQRHYQRDWEKPEQPHLTLNLDPTLKPSLPPVEGCAQ